MFEQYVSVYLAPSVFTKTENFINFLVNYSDEIFKNNYKLSVAPETRLFVDHLTSEGTISPLVKHQLRNRSAFNICLDNYCYRLRDCLAADSKNGKVLVIIGENSYPDLYVGADDGIDIAEMKKDGKLSPIEFTVCDLEKSIDLL